jgi:hypothetical protein
MMNDSKAMRCMEAFVMNNLEAAMDAKITTYGNDRKDEFGKRCKDSIFHYIDRRRH